MLQRGYSGDGCESPSTLCKYDMRKGDSFVELGKGATIKCFFGVPCRAQYFIIASCS